jgi:hypothetical protein
MKLLSKKLYPLKEQQKVYLFLLNMIQTLKNKYNEKKLLPFSGTNFGIHICSKLRKTELSVYRPFSHLKLATRYQLFYKNFAEKMTNKSL